MGTAGNIMEKAPEFIPESAMKAKDQLANGEGNGSAAQASKQKQEEKKKKMMYQEEVKHFRLRSHVPDDERLGSINVWRQFVSSVFEAEFHTFFFVLEITLFVYIVYLGLAHWGLWPREFNHAAAEIAGAVKGTSFAAILVLGLVRFGRAGRTISNRRKQRVATPEEEIGQFRIEVAFSFAVYAFILT